jgi:hypothetical protein
MYPEHAYLDDGLVVYNQDPILPYWPDLSAICCNDRSCPTIPGLNVSGGHEVDAGLIEIGLNWSE